MVGLDDRVVIEMELAHKGHLPGSSEDLARLPMDERVVAKIKQLALLPGASQKVVQEGLDIFVHELLTSEGIITDKVDKRFYPNPKTVINTMTAARREAQIERLRLGLEVVQRLSLKAPTRLLPPAIEKIEELRDMLQGTFSEGHTEVEAIIRGATADLAGKRGRRPKYPLAADPNGDVRRPGPGRPRKRNCKGLDMSLAIQLSTTLLPPPHEALPGNNLPSTSAHAENPTCQSMPSGGPTPQQQACRQESVVQSEQAIPVGPQFESVHLAQQRADQRSGGPPVSAMSSLLVPHHPPPLVSVPAEESLGIEQHISTHPNAAEQVPHAVVEEEGSFPTEQQFSAVSMPQQGEASPEYAPRDVGLWGMNM